MKGSDSNAFKFTSPGFVVTIEYMDACGVRRPIPGTLQHTSEIATAGPGRTQPFLLFSASPTRKSGVSSSTLLTRVILFNQSKQRQELHIASTI